MDNRRSVLILSDFNASNFAAYLANSTERPLVDARVGQMAHGAGLVLLHDSVVEVRDRDVIIWTEPHRVSEGFSALIAGEDANPVSILAEVDEFAAAIASLARKARGVLVPSWVMPHGDRGFGLLALRNGSGPVSMLMRMNLRLADRLSECDNAYLLDAQRWMQAGGRQAFDARLWHMGKIPFANAVFKEGANEIKAALRALSGDTRKLVVVDLDDTLWGGVLGDEGWESLRLGGHDAVGEAYVDFQRGLRRLSRRGIILGIVSKNDEGPAIEAITKHPEMVLRCGDFAGWRINWNDKAENVAALAAELNIGLQSVVFVDDNPVERGRVREALPEVLVPDWPASPLLFSSSLAALNCFDTAAHTPEDRQRQAAYRAESARVEERRAAASLDDWLRSLQLKVHVAELNDANAMRATQLLNKTNQMNLSTRRLTGAELRSWASDPRHKVWVFRVTDKFGDAGLTGILSLALQDGDARIVDFVLSCRVIGRQVEEAMMYQAMRYAGDCGMQTLSAEYIPTAKNGPCLRFLERSGLENSDGRVFRWPLSRPYAPPPHVDVHDAAGSPN
jgi:FkbH-like protein